MSRFDMSKLSKLDCLDVAGALYNFSSYDDFWVALAKLHAEANLYLRSHTASVVIYDLENRKHFYKEMASIRPLLQSLRVRHVDSMFHTIDDAVERSDANSLNDALGVFYADMDIVRKSIESAIIPEDEIGVKQTSKPIVMVVDDAPEMLQAAVDSLTEHYRVLALLSGFAALKALERYKPELFILDIMLPGMTGYQLAEKLRAMDEYKETPILFVTGINSEKHELVSKRYGGSHLFHKPVPPDHLLETVNSFLKPE